MLLTLKIRKGNIQLFAWQLFHLRQKHSRGETTYERGPLGNLLTGEQRSEEVHLWQWGVMTSHHKSAPRGHTTQAACVWSLCVCYAWIHKWESGSVVDIASLWCIMTSTTTPFSFLCLHFLCWACSTSTWSSDTLTLISSGTKLIQTFCPLK